MKRMDPVLVTSAVLGGMTGLRSMSAVALLAHEFAAPGRSGRDASLIRFIASPAASKLLLAFAGGEMLADKTPIVPDRTMPGPLLGRAFIGSVAAAAHAVDQRRPALFPAIAGAVAAVASTFAGFHVRRFAANNLGLPDPVLGLLEDAVVVGAGRRIGRSL